MSRELHHSLYPAVSLAPAVRTTDANGTGVDLAGYGAAECVFIFGASGDTLSGSTKVEGVVQESDDNVNYTDVADDDLIGTEPVVDSGDEDDDVYHVGYKGTKRYIRLKLDFTGTHSNGIPCSTLVLRGHKRHGQTEAI